MSSESPLWDIRGWKRLTVNEDPSLVDARKEFQAWVTEVPVPHSADVGARLRSETDDAHLSARLELYLHHYFRSNGWEVRIHPQVAYTSNRPDFLVAKGDAKLLVECRGVFDQPAVAQQDQRLRQLADETTSRLGRTVILHPLSNLPPSIPTRRIRSWIQQQQISGNSPHLLEFDFWDDFLGHHYGVRVILLTLNDGGEALTGVHGLMSQAQTITNAQQLRAALQEKASKYGKLDVPYVIAISGEAKFPVTTKHEVDALFGDRVWNIPQPGPATVTETRNSNGFFISRRNNVVEYPDVSAVLVYRFKWLDNGHKHHMHLYHNPFATRSVDTSYFPDIPQLVREKTLMRWVNGEPEPY